MTSIDPSSFYLIACAVVMVFILATGTENWLRPGPTLILRLIVFALAGAGSCLLAVILIGTALSNLGGVL